MWGVGCGQWELGGLGGLRITDGHDGGEGGGKHGASARVGGEGQVRGRREHPCSGGRGVWQGHEHEK